MREDYEKRGLNYRRGYLLHGKGGTGKTSVVELIASHHRLSCYNIILNAKGMTDATLVNLAATVPPHSLVIFDEFDKEWKTIRETKGKAITEAGLLNAIGGTPPLHAGVIVLILVNDITVFDTPEWSTLLRPGRIDKVFHFTESICG